MPLKLEFLPSHESLWKPVTEFKAGDVLSRRLTDRLYLVVGSSNRRPNDYLGIELVRLDDASCYVTSATLHEGKADLFRKVEATLKISL